MKRGNRKHCNSGGPIKNRVRAPESQSKAREQGACLWFPKLNTQDGKKHTSLQTFISKLKLENTLGTERIISEWK